MESQCVKQYSFINNCFGATEEFLVNYTCTHTHIHTYLPTYLPTYLAYYCLNCSPTDCLINTLLS